MSYIVKKYHRDGFVRIEAEDSNSVLIIKRDEVQIDNTTWDFEDYTLILRGSGESLAIHSLGVQGLEQVAKMVMTNLYDSFEIIEHISI